MYISTWKGKSPPDPRLYRPGKTSVHIPGSGILQEPYIAAFVPTSSDICPYTVCRLFRSIFRPCSLSFFLRSLHIRTLLLFFIHLYLDIYTTHPPLFHRLRPSGFLGYLLFFRQESREKNLFFLLRYR